MDQGGGACLNQFLFLNEVPFIDTLSTCRESHNAQFNRMPDLFFVCLLEGKAYTTFKQYSEIADADVNPIDLDDYFQMPVKSLLLPSHAAQCSFVTQSCFNSLVVVYPNLKSVNLSFTISIS